MSMYDMFVHPRGPAGHAAARLMARVNIGMMANAIELLELDPHANVLEIGFGPGVALQRLLEAVPDGHVTGVDPSAVMHQHARERNTAAVKEGRLELYRGTAADLPVSPGAMDAVLAIDNLHFWPSIPAGLSEIGRVLRPGGIFVCAFSPPSGGPPPHLAALLVGHGYESSTAGIKTRQGHLFQVRVPHAGTAT
jgi:ubiquinone/menaquinone biosynthesis C-methylase UbiE